MSGQVKDVPCGIQCLRHVCNSCCAQQHINWKPWHQAGILVITFLAYTCYHLTRKPISVVKNILSQNCSGISPSSDIPANDSIHWCDWVPFDTDDAPALLGLLDSSFLFAYAAAMFLSGFIAERVNLRYFLSLGMIASGISCYLFGIARPYNIHSLWYFILVQAAGGIFQTTGWPGVVTVMGNWFGKSKRGFIFGVWNSHTSLGNILGSLIAAKYVEHDWGLSFMVPGAIMGLVGFVVFLFLVPNPTDVGCSPPNSHVYRKIEASNSSDDDVYADVGDGPHITGEDRVIYRCVYREQVAVDDPNNSRSESSPMLSGHQRIYSASQDSAIGFVGAMKIPGVIEYSLSLFFAKLVSYTFLYWLPLYIAASTTYGTTLSAYLSVLFDVGGIVGAIAAGVLSDYSGMSALTCVIMFGLTFPTLFIYDYVRNTSLGVNVILLLLAGLLVNGPYALITTAVSTELGTHPSLGDNSKALATVTAIIDGTGSIGAAVGPLLAGLISRWAGWHNVFYMLMASDLLALLLLSRLVYSELKLYMQRRVF
ncbi:glucose-6-phosphate exchanger SLC37A2 isoform X1 [Odontomachus brunneus]|uniref:glucose-6-phosphate exchanger SLC37A2 isoform X1 n=1 Tax=Odontomachus brunneus TaxID=486640 RepID=UPI0013F17F4D|nr:glucose-6-phosphate exchanger SLC37A2 isoform X1 [Odontomachus brunneus]XP_032663399.1 glucose-6-phosphate exchanger SLC37A2 isoform X1 [Odontomachus brunneus]XP_032663400.1 glucose-6-phosphate exchanger SLC37A2 isoform X1 [Odontomachus brunneus]